MRYWVLGALFVVLLLVLGNALMAWRVDAGFTAKVAAIRAAGDPASLADLKPKRIPDEKNAAAIIAHMRPRLDAFDAGLQKLLKTPPFAAVGNDFLGGDSMTPEQAAAVGAFLADYADVEAMIAQAAACNEYASMANFSLPFSKFLDAQLKIIQTTRAAARLMALRMRLLVGEGRLDETIARGVELLRISELQEREPGTGPFLVSIAVRGVTMKQVTAALEAGPVSKETHAALVEELARQDDAGKVRRAMRLERALSVSAAEEQMSPPSTNVAFRLFGWTVKRQFTAPLEYYEALMPELNRTWPELRRADSSIAAQQGKYGPLAALLLPTITATLDAAQRDAAIVRSLRVLNALRQAEDAGGQPTGLADAGLAAAATMDPCSGKPLLVKKTERGWIVYSVGRDRKDDGGKWDDLNDYGVGPVAAVK